MKKTTALIICSAMLSHEGKCMEPHLDSHDQKQLLPVAEPVSVIARSPAFYAAFRSHSSPQIALMSIALNAAIVWPHFIYNNKMSPYLYPNDMCLHAYYGATVCSLAYYFYAKKVGFWCKKTLPSAVETSTLKYMRRGNIALNLAATLYGVYDGMRFMYTRSDKSE